MIYVELESAKYTFLTVLYWQQIFTVVSMTSVSSVRIMNAVKFQSYEIHLQDHTHAQN